MKADALFIITMIVFVFVAWVATGGPSRPIATAGPWITPVTRTGEESQGYRALAPSNPISSASYPRQIGNVKSTISAGPDQYQRSGSATAGHIYIDRSTAGPTSGNPNQEYVSVVNGGTATTTLSGWSIHSKATNTASIVPTVTLAPGKRVVVVSGRSSASQLPSLCGTSGACAFLNRNLEMYASSKETITLTDASGKVVDSFSY